MPTADLFCKVVDNYGDAGIVWRLATGLLARGFGVRIFIDDPDTLAKITQLGPRRMPGAQTDLGPRDKPEDLNCSNKINAQPIEIIHWNDPLAEPITPADLVIDTLEGHAPDEYKTAMAARDPKPVWIYYEHLSAEKWVTDFHLIPSPHPRLPITQHFFYPGFTAGTGGLLWPDEPLSSRKSQRDYPGPSSTCTAEDPGSYARDGASPDNHLKISLFSYQNPGIPAIINALPDQTILNVPAGLPVTDIAAHLGIAPPAPGTTLAHQNATINVIPFMPQSDFAAFLARHDINFVRGEDSITTAILIGKPLIWHIYPQDDAAHIHKLHAFCALYTDGLTSAPAAAFTTMNLAWNGHGDVTIAWLEFLAHLPILTLHAQEFALKTRNLGNSVQNLVDFYTQIR